MVGAWVERMRKRTAWLRECTTRKVGREGERDRRVLEEALSNSDPCTSTACILARWVLVNLALGRGALGSSMNLFLHEHGGPIHRSVPQGGFASPRLTEMPQKTGRSRSALNSDHRNATDHSQRAARLSKENTILWIFGRSVRTTHCLLWSPASATRIRSTMCGNISCP